MHIIHCYVFSQVKRQHKKGVAGSGHRLQFSRGAVLSSLTNLVLVACHAVLKHAVLWFIAFVALSGVLCSLFLVPHYAQQLHRYSLATTILRRRHWTHGTCWTTKRLLLSALHLDVQQQFLHDIAMCQLEIGLLQLRPFILTCCQQLDWLLHSEDG